MSEKHPGSLTHKQRTFVIALLLLGTLIAVGVVYFLNPKSAFSPAGAPSGAAAASHAGGSGR